MELSAPGGVHVGPPAWSPAVLYRAIVPLPGDLSPARRGLMRRTETRVWSAVFLSMMVGWGTRVLIGQSTDDLGIAVFSHLVAALIPGLPVAVLVMRFAFGRNVALWRQEAHTARLEGALLVARTAAHRINNALAPVVGYAELLTLPRAGANDTPTSDASRASDAKVHTYAGRILEAATQAAAEVVLLQQIVRLEEDRTGPMTLLDLEASAGIPR